MDIQEGQTATNPKTGQKVVFHGGQWVSAGGASGPSVGSVQEQKRFIALQDAGDQARTMIRPLLTARQLINKTPTGFIEGPIQGVKRMLGDDSVPTTAREQLNAIQNKMVMAFRVPGTGSISDSERDSFRKSLFDPSYQRSSNQAIIGSSMADQFANLAKAKLAAKWRARVGSLDAKSPKGVTFDEALSKMQTSPSFRAGLERARTIDPAEYEGHGGGSVIDFHQLPE